MDTGVKSICKVKKVIWQSGKTDDFNQTNCEERETVMVMAWVSSSGRYIFLFFAPKVCRYGDVWRLHAIWRRLSRLPKWPHEKVKSSHFSGEFCGAYFVHIVFYEDRLHASDCGAHRTLKQVQCKNILNFLLEFFSGTKNMYVWENRRINTFTSICKKGISSRDLVQQVARMVYRSASAILYMWKYPANVADRTINQTVSHQVI